MKELVCGFLGHLEIKDLGSQDASAFLSAADGHFCPQSIPGTWGQGFFFFLNTWSLPTRMLNTCSWLLSRNSPETEVSCKVSSESNQRSKHYPRRELLQRAVSQVTRSQGGCPNYSSGHYDKIHTNATSRRIDFVPSLKGDSLLWGVRTGHMCLQFSSRHPECECSGRFLQDPIPWDTATHIQGKPVWKHPRQCPQECPWVIQMSSQVDNKY